MPNPYIEKGTGVNVKTKIARLVHAIRRSRRPKGTS